MNKMALLNKMACFLEARKQPVFQRWTYQIKAPDLIIVNVTFNFIFDFEAIKNLQKYVRYSRKKITKNTRPLNYS